MKIFTFITKHFNNLSITSKLFVGLTPVFLIFIALSYTSLQNLKSEKTNLKVVSTLSENLAKILDINREISEVQRMVNVYSVIGGKSIIAKIKKSYNLLVKQLREAENKVLSESRKELIGSLKIILDSYGENIYSLENRFTYRDNLINTKIPDVFYSGLSVLETELSRVRKNTNQNEIIQVQAIIQKWYRVNYLTSQFLSKKNVKYKDEIYRIEESIRLNSTLNTKLKLSIMKVINEFNDIFDQAVQANRVYSSLVNVVMAGEAIEFTNISKQLREESLLELKFLLTENDRSFNVKKRLIYVSLSVILPLLILIGLYYQLSIANGIKKISETFRGFIEGHLESEIPGLSRKDEVGQLAQAASKFRDVSIEIKKEQARAEQLTESKSMFLATMSHEIRTPMNAILSCANLLLDDSKDPEHLSLLDTIKTSGDSLLVLINDILDFSKIEAGKISLENEVFNLKECIYSVVELLSPNASEKGVLIVYHIDERIPEFIKSDTTRLRQVLVNLVGNAIKFTKNKVTISVKLKEAVGNKVELYFSVEDNGIGVNDEAQSLLFQEFSQVDASTTRKFGGTGLGLAICKNLVEAMGGQIGVDSRENIGSNFSFTIQVTKEEAPTETDDINTFKDKIYLKADSSLKILMAEDNSINQMVARKIIEKIGYRVDIVTNGREAVNAVHEKEYDIIFMDQHMPEMDGIEATITIRGLDIRQPKIFALTASAFSEDRDRCIGAGMDGFLTKPIVVNQIISALNECCKNKTDIDT